jgi:hypothetical protein
MDKSLKELKKQFTIAAILTYLVTMKTCIVETDTTGFCPGGILSQKDDEGSRHRIGFHSKKFQPAEINFKVYNKELLAIIDAFKGWHRYLEGALCTVMVYSDHQNLKSFTIRKVVNRRQAHWAQELASYDFNIVYHLGSQHIKPDPVSRHSEYCPEKEGSEDQATSIIFSPNNSYKITKKKIELFQTRS